MLASEFFDIIEEPTEKGGVRVLYRPKPQLAYCAFGRLLQSCQSALKSIHSTASNNVRLLSKVILESPCTFL
jgi:hypothetical protein